MKVLIISAAIALVALTMVVPITRGLQCYICFSGDRVDRNAPGYHEDCKEGKIPDSLLEACINRNAVNPDTQLAYNASEVQRFEHQGAGYACGKIVGKSKGKKAAVKFCTFAMPGNTDICTSGRSEEEGGGKSSQCTCHDDKCNESIGLNPTMANIFAALSVKIYF